MSQVGIGFLLGLGVGWFTFALFHYPEFRKKVIQGLRHLSAPRTSKPPDPAKSQGPNQPPAAP